MWLTPFYRLWLKEEHHRLRGLKLIQYVRFTYVQSHQAFLGETFSSLNFWHCPVLINWTCLLLTYYVGLEYHFQRPADCNTQNDDNSILVSDSLKLAKPSVQRKSSMLYLGLWKLLHSLIFNRPHLYRSFRSLTDWPLVFSMPVLQITICTFIVRT